MANSYVEYTSVAGGTTNLNVPFSYLDPAQVELYIDDVLQTVVTDYNFTSPTNIALVTPTSGGEDILIQRRTEIDSAAVTFSNAMLVDTDLNTSHLQNFYLHQEVVDGLAIGTFPVLGTALTSGAAANETVLTADGAGGVSWQTINAVVNAEVIDDLTPQLGGDLDLNGSQILAAEVGSVAAPDYSFEVNTGTGFYAPATNRIGVAIGGTARFGWRASFFESEVSDGPALANESPSGTNPTLIPNQTDLTTGVGANAAGDLSLVQGGSERVRIDAGVINMFAPVDLVAVDLDIQTGGSLFQRDTLNTTYFETVVGAGTVTTTFTNAPAVSETGAATYDWEADTSFSWEIGGNTRVDILSTRMDLYEGHDLRLYNNANLGYWELLAGSNAVIDAGTLTDLDITGFTDVNITPTGSVIIDNGASVYTDAQITLQSDAAAVKFYDDGAGANIGRWTFGTASGAFRLRGFSDDEATNFDAIVVNRSANNIDSIYLYASGNATFGTQDRTADGNTSGAFVKDHDGNNVDVGFNVLNEKGWGAADTIEAQHAGGSWGKANTTARTLTLLPTTDTDFPVGATCEIYNFGTSGNLTVSEGASGTLYKVVAGSGQVDSTGSLTVGPGGVCTLWRRSTDNWYLFGSEIT